MERLKQQMEFIAEVDKLKSIVRQTYIADGSRKENDSEHSWHMALMCVLLSEYANEEIDVLKTVTMVLIHDIVEIDAGDTYAYDETGHLDKREREEKAADRIFGLLPEDQAKKMRKLWDEFEEVSTPEAKFAAAIDRVQPILLNDDAGGVSWSEHGVTLSQILKRNEHTSEGSEVLWEFCKRLIHKNVEKGTIKDA